MTRRTFLLFLVLAFAVITTAQEMKDFRSAGRVGHIRSLHEERAKLIEESGQLHESSRIVTEETKFSEKGEKLATRIVHPDGQTWTENSFRYEYDVEGRILAMDVLGPDGKLQYKFINTYNKNGKLNGKAYRDKNGQPIFDLIYAYDEAGNISRLHTRKPGKGYSDEVYTYSADGIEAERQDYVADGVLHERVITTYDATGRQTEIVGYTGAGRVIARAQYSYDAKDRNNVTEVVLSGMGDIVQRREHYTYDEFDEKGNWTKRHTVKETARGSEIVKEMEVTYRTFTYY